MKKLTKIIAVLAALTMLFAIPVMAREVSFSSENTDVLIQLLNGNAAKVQGQLADWKKVQCGPGADAIIAAQTAMVNSKLAAVNKECAQNHINLLKGKVYNAKQLEATRLAQLNNFKTLYAGSASWIGELQKAQKEYDDCVAARVAAEAYLAAAQTKLAPFLK
ncbi:MAG: hypothetical protein K6D90_03190 [Lachnospiraceae bacterium]|nr:hypothetical protein [Lachnospiraceae bacterium]